MPGNRLHLVGRMMRINGLIMMLAITIFSVPQQVFAAKSSPQTILVIDGSGSMWGRIDKREKIAVVRSLLAREIASLKDQTELGIMSYGHRRRRDCRDIEMIVPIGPIEPKPYARAIKRLLPRGKTPIASALHRAAQALALASLSGKNGQSRIILVADGNENCRLDPCQTAVDIASNAPHLRIDVIGFGITDKEVAGLSCISKATHGHFFKADNSQQLEKAVKQIFAGFSARPPGKPQAAQKKKTPPGLYLSASLASNSPALPDDLSWRIYAHGDSSASGSSPVKRDNGAQPVLQLPAGKYHVEVRYGPLLAAKDMEIAAGSAQKQHMVFEAGIITATARLGKGAASSKDVIFTLYDIAKGPARPGNIISQRQEKTAHFYLPAGKYSLKARAGNAETRQQFNLKAGQRQKLDLLINAGQISLATQLAPNMPNLQDVQYTIYRRGPKTDREFVRTLDPLPDLTLPAGDYLVVAQSGSAVRQEKLTLSAGEKRTLTLDLDAGILNLSSNFDNSAPKDRSQIAYTIKATNPANGKTIKLKNGHLTDVIQPLPTRSFKRSFVLAAGEYEIQARSGNSNARATGRTRVKAGQKTAQLVALQAGQINLSLVIMAGDQPLPGVFWSIVDTSGKQVASASSPTPRLTLSNGSYKVVADYLGHSYQRDFVIHNGDNRKIELNLQ